MWIHRPLMIRKSIGLRFLSHVASEALVEDPAPLFTYLEGFPRPEPKYAETILAIPRSKSGKNISAKEREAGRVPSIVFEQLKGEEGGNKRLISVQTKQIRKLVNHLGYSFFLSRLFDLEIRSNIDSSDEIIERVRVLPRKCYSLRKEEKLELLFSLLSEKSFPIEEEGFGKTHNTVEKESSLPWNSSTAQTCPSVLIDLSRFPAITRRR